MATKTTKTTKSAKRTTPAQPEAVSVSAGTWESDPTPVPDPTLVSEIASVSERCSSLEERLKKLEATDVAPAASPTPQTNNCRCDSIERQVSSLRQIVDLCATRLKHGSGPGFIAALKRLQKGK